MNFDFRTWCLRHRSLRLHPKDNDLGIGKQDIRSKSYDPGKSTNSISVEIHQAKVSRNSLRRTGFGERGSGCSDIVLVRTWYSMCYDAIFTMCYDLYDATLKTVRRLVDSCCLFRRKTIYQNPSATGLVGKDLPGWERSESISLSSHSSLHPWKGCGGPVQFMMGWTWITATSFFFEEKCI